MTTNFVKIKNSIFNAFAQFLDRARKTEHIFLVIVAILIGTLSGFFIRLDKLNIK
jgi:hypothetical protein